MSLRPRKRGAVRRFTWRWIRRAMLLMVGVLGLVFILRAYESWQDAPLEPWHSVALDEVKVSEIDGLD